MASEVDICNLALSRIGDNATVSSINPPEGSMQAEHCQRYYPMARDTMLELHNWHFATRETTLARLVQDSDDDLEQAVFVVPANTIKVIAVKGLNGQVLHYRQETNEQGERIIYCDACHEEVKIHFIERITDTTRYSPLFVDALGWLLASHLAGPIIKGTEGIKISQSCVNAFNIAMSKAVVSDSNQQRIGLEHCPDWIQARM
ncbi:hypothetical protein [Basilea psittacipulmonis]|uniref:Uncharacterized protein n=1 Tax=Basilea psittacipulmonis DSM 24701 TaxID=1072685 RepID=A0A077DHS2_9BURK|nr:hypothetical protein [Basilea psittacipulmonis]AIL33097.1 hypothetical protein IX83_07070 [Basilea psittacipulmonis DSM 24701]